MERKHNEEKQQAQQNTHSQIQMAQQHIIG